MKIEIEVADIETTAKALNNAAAVFGYMCWTAALGCKIPDRLKNIKLLDDEERKTRFLIVKDICEQVEFLERKKQDEALG